MKKDEKKTLSYDGVLLEPIQLPRGTIVEKKWKYPLAVAKYVSESYKIKMNALFFFYGYDPEKKESLFIIIQMLAIRHIPGFRVELDTKDKKLLAGKRPGPGRPLKVESPEYRYALLWLEEQHKKFKSRNSSLSTNSICKIISKQKDLPPILMSKGKSLSPKRISEHLKESSKRKPAPTEIVCSQVVSFCSIEHREEKLPTTSLLKSLISRLQDLWRSRW